MNWREAVQAMLDGKKVRIKAWNNDSSYIHFPSKAEMQADSQIYEEPKPEIKLTPEHVGKRVRLRNGNIAIISAYHRQNNSYYTYNSYYTCFDVWYESDGKVKNYVKHEYDIVEILD